MAEVHASLPWNDLGIYLRFKGRRPCHLLMQAGKIMAAILLGVPSELRCPPCEHCRARACKGQGVLLMPPEQVGKSAVCPSFLPGHWQMPVGLSQF